MTSLFGGAPRYHGNDVGSQAAATEVDGHILQHRKHTCLSNMHAFFLRGEDKSTQFGSTSSLQVRPRSAVYSVSEE